MTYMPVAWHIPSAYIGFLETRLLTVYALATDACNLQMQGSPCRPPERIVLEGNTGGK